MQESNSLSKINVDEQMLQKQSRAVIFKGSKSFSLASLFLTPHQKEGAYYLYAWCRYCDDQTDDQILGFSSVQTSTPEKVKRIEELTQQTRRAFVGDFRSESEVATPVFWGVIQLAKKYRVPEVYFLELLEGMKMDLEGASYLTTKDLDLYCYRVAGVVGLMMCHIMGIKDERALENAAKMGMAMQLTNICRDIKEDFEISRVYLPHSLLAQNGLDTTNFLKLQNRSKLRQVVTSLLKRADEYYEAGDQGISSLPFRAACAITAARNLYSSIGLYIILRGPNAWETRTSIPLMRKLLLLSKSFIQMCRQIPYRIRNKDQCIEISSIWRLS